MKNNNEESKEEVRIDGVSVDITGNKGEKVRIGPGGIHVRDEDSEVRIGWSGIRIRDGKSRFSISAWKPLVGCAVFLLLFAALLTFMIAGIIRLMIR